MKRLFILSFCLIFCLISHAQEITIIPQFSVADTLKYRTNAHVVMYHGKDSLVSTSSFLPEIVVESKNEQGFVLRISSKLESFQIECTDPESEGRLPKQQDTMKDFVYSMVLKVQLDKNCRPDTILNIDEVKDTMLNAYLKIFKKELDVEIDNPAEWEMDTKPIIIGFVNMMCNTKHLIEQQFGNLPYFTFIGIPLKNKPIPTSMVLSDDIRVFCGELKDLDMKISRMNKTETSNAHDTGGYVIELWGQKDKTMVTCKFTYAQGIPNHGSLSVQKKDEKLTCTYTFERLN